MSEDLKVGDIVIVKGQRQRLTVTYADGSQECKHVEVWADGVGLKSLPKAVLLVLPEETQWIVQLEDGVWIAPWSGDPGRTLVREDAYLFDVRADAVRALAAARSYRPFPDAHIVEVTQ